MLLSRFKIVGHSMTPTLQNNDHVIVSKVPYFFSKPSVGDIVVYEKSGEVYIKRVSQINGTKYFLIGDNKKDSLDSRKHGFIDRNKIKGKVILKI